MKPDTTVVSDPQRDVFRPVPNRAERRQAVRRAGYGKQLSKAWTRDFMLGRAR